MKLINYGRQYISNSDIKSVAQVLRSDYLTQGPYVYKFENELKAKFGSKFCTAVANGSAALHLLGLALGWKKKDIILTTPLSFVATSNCILHTGATPIFVDIDEDTGNICPKKIIKKIEVLKRKRKKIKAIIAIDYGGMPSKWTDIYRIAKKNNIVLINDCCHALGSSIKKNTKYAIKYADFVSFSFHPVKTITTGEGGAILTNNSQIDKKLKILRTHGIQKDNLKSSWKYDVKYLSFNYRISDIQCALGISQLKKLNTFVKKRRKIANLYNKNLSKISNIELPNNEKNIVNSYHLYPIKIKFKNLSIKKNEFFKILFKNKIKLQVHYIPIYRHLIYKKKFNLKSNAFPSTENFYNEVVSLPIYYNLSKKKQLYVINKIKEVIKKYS